jgi:hypothetical protein
MPEKDLQPEWAEFTPQADETVDVSARAGFRLRTGMTVQDLLDMGLTLEDLLEAVGHVDINSGTDGVLVIDGTTGTVGIGTPETIVPKLTDAPASVVSLTAKAFQDSIHLEWVPPTGNTIASNPVAFILQRSKDGGSTWADVSGTVDGTTQVKGSTYEWLFDRGTDGYPEKTVNAGWTQLALYAFRIKAVNSGGVASVAWTTRPSVDMTAYRSWLPLPPTVSGSAWFRNVSLSWHESIDYYPALRAEVQVSLDNSNFYEPATSLSSYTSENNWRQDATLGNVCQVYGNSFAHAVPLSGQAIGVPIDTMYYYRVRYVLDCPWTGSEGAGASSGGKRASAWSSVVTVLAKANGAYDLVAGAVTSAAIALGAVTADKISVENLAAIQGLFASVAGGGDDELNYWNLSAVPQGSRPVGSFRAGNATVYIFTNPGADGTLADPYIALIAGDDYIKLTGTGIVMSDTLMGKVGANSATINAIFTQAIEIGDGGYSYYFAGSGTTRKAIRVGSNEMSWGTYPIGGLFTPSNLITQPTTDKYATLAGDFRTPVKTGSYSYAESSLSVTASSKSALLVLRNKTWLLAYPTSNGVVYTNTRVNGVWGTPTNAIGISAYYMCLRELPNGNVILVYSKYTDRKLYCKIYDGTTWSDELLIADTPVYDVSVEVAQNGDATVIYNKVTPNAGLYATLGTASSSYTTWTVEATPIFSNGSIVDVTTVVNTEGIICIAFLFNIPITGYRVVRILGKYGSGWSAPAVIINSSSYTNLSLVNFLDGQLGLICKNTSHYPCLFKTVGGSWGAVNVLANVQRWHMDFTFNQATNTIEGVCVDGSGNLREVRISDTANYRIGAGIIESGVAPDGSRWQKTSDGMLECWGYIASISSGGQIVFPAEFNATPPYIAPHAGPNSSGPTYYEFIQPYAATATGFRISYKYAHGTDVANMPMNWRAKGLAKV